MTVLYFCIALLCNYKYSFTKLLLQENYFYQSDKIESLLPRISSPEECFRLLRGPRKFAGLTLDAQHVKDLSGKMR